MSEALRVDPSAAGPVLARDLPDDPAAAAEVRQRAALTVAGFAQASALDALDALLTQGADEARDVARQACDRTDLLDREVRRFHALAKPAT